MKRMQLIAVALCLIMIATVGAGVVAAKQQENPRQAGASQVYFYNLAPADGHGKGILKIDTKQQTFLFNGQGFAPSQTFILLARAASGDAYIFASAKSTAAGNLNLKGAWSTSTAAQPGSQGFGVGLLLPGKAQYTGTIQRTSLDDKDYDLVFTDAYNNKITLYLDPSKISPPNTLPSVIATAQPVTIFVNDAYTVTFVYGGTAYTAPYFTTTLNPYLSYEAYENGGVFSDAIYGTVWLNTFDGTPHVTPASGVHVEVYWNSGLLGWESYKSGTTDSQGHFCVKGIAEDAKLYKAEFTLGDLSASTGTLPFDSGRPSYC
ncbi:MAG: hypothetical protein ACXVIG_07195 [Halobacteriota archaeon]